MSISEPVPARQLHRQPPVLVAVLVGLMLSLAGWSGVEAAPGGQPIPAGCSAVVLGWPANTPIATIARAVTPASGLLAIWRAAPGGSGFQGYSPRTAARADFVRTARAGESVILCMAVSGVLAQPVGAAPVGRAAPRPPAALAAVPGLPAGAALPDAAVCADRVRRDGWERRPENAAANRQPPARLPAISGVNAAGNARHAARVDGAFSGTTDEIIQWAACKWGMDTEIARAMAWQESSWRQSATGPRGTHGLMQIKRTAHPASFPAAQRSTAFNVDYALAWWRSCVDGYIPWLSAAARGDVWGCVASYASGRWNDPYGREYATAVRRHVAERPWLE